MIFRRSLSHRHGRPRRMLTMDIRRTPIGLWARLRDSHKSGPQSGWSLAWTLAQRNDCSGKSWPGYDIVVHGKSQTNLTVGAQASKQNGAVVLWNPRAGSKLLFAEGITWVRKQTLRSILPALRRALSGCDVIRCSSALVSAMCSFQRSPSFRRKDNFCRPHSTKTFSWFCCRRRLSWFPGWYNLFISWGENYDAYCIRKW